MQMVHVRENRLQYTRNRARDVFQTVLEQIVSLIRGRDTDKSVIWWTLYHFRGWEIIAVSAAAILGPQNETWRKIISAIIGKGRLREKSSVKSFADGLGHLFVVGENECLYIFFMKVLFWAKGHDFWNSGFQCIFHF